MKISSIPSGSYAEVGQKSPLRWSVLYVENDGTAVGQHAWWKCKDFLNDSVVFLRTGKKFGIYGYTNELKINDGLSYIALKNVPAFFEKNLALLNKWLEAKKFPPIQVVEAEVGATDVERVIGVPTLYWGNTFLISVITSLIRSCVYVEATTFDKCVKEEPTLSGYWEKVQAAMDISKVGEMDVRLFVNYQYDGKLLKKTPTHTIHNAGLQTWINSGAF